MFVPPPFLLLNIFVQTLRTWRTLEFSNFLKLFPTYCMLLSCSVHAYPLPVSQEIWHPRKFGTPMQFFLGKLAPLQDLFHFLGAFSLRYFAVVSPPHSLLLRVHVFLRCSLSLTIHWHIIWIINRGLDWRLNWIVIWINWGLDCRVSWTRNWTLSWIRNWRISWATGWVMVELEASAVDGLFKRLSRRSLHPKPTLTKIFMNDEWSSPQVCLPYDVYFVNSPSRLCLQH